jgi:hypothetical protein
MSESIHFEVGKLEIAEPSIHRTLTVFPVLGEDHRPPYVSLHEAFDNRWIEVGEHGDGARVPELEVINTSDHAVLILDGEILLGAKQNRTLNTSVLLAPRSRTTVPVSCVEAGRWHEVSPLFGDANAVLPHRVRWAKSSSVAHALRTGAGHRSDQGRVWSEIEMKLGEHQVHSPSSSMGELFARKQKELEGYLDALPCLQGQCGLIVAVGGTVVGADILSRPSVYAGVHRRLLKGYAAEDLERHAGDPPHLEVANAREFLVEILAGEPAQNPGVGLGREFRFEGRRGQATLLAHEGTVLHGVFLGEQEANERDTTLRPERPIFRRRGRAR